jgi:hypothetical protein
MRFVVDHVAAVAGEIHRHAPIVADRQGVQELLQIRPMVLVVSPGDGVRRSAQTVSFLTCLLVRSEESHRGRVVVQFLQTDLKLGDHMTHDGQNQLWTGAGKQLRQTTPQPVVMKQRHLLRPEVEQVRSKASGPRPHGIDWLPRHPCCHFGINGRGRLPSSVKPPRPAAEHSHPFGWDWTQGTAIPPLRMSSCLLAIASSAAGKSLHKTDGHPRGRWRGIACMVCGPHKTRTQSGEIAAKAWQGSGFFARLMVWRMSDMPPKTAS